MLRDFLPIVLGMGATLLFLYNKPRPNGDLAVLASSRDRYINLSALRSDCDRECTAEDLPRVCRYHFVIETHLFQSHCEQCDNTSYMWRPMLAINRQVPGPAIHVCEGDFVVVNVKNALRGLEITLHWHGMRQRGSSYMDGVPLITQCPIQSGTSFQYVFQANAGTHFYRAHSVAHQADGIYGPMIVRQSSLQDATHRSYDLDLKEHVITISPLTYSALTTHVGLERVPVHSLLINGYGLLKNRTVHTDDTQPKLYVSRGRRYRLRVISASALDCPVLFSVDRHHFTVIQADGSPVKPFNMSSIILHPGERFDLVLRTDQLHGVYELNVQGYHDCEGLHQEGLLVYYNTSYERTALNRNATCLRKAHEGQLDRYVPELRSLSPLTALKEQADYTVYLPFDMILMDTSPLQSDFTYTYSNKSPDYPSYLSKRDTQNRVPRMGNISFEYPSSPLVYEQEQRSPVVMCSQSERNTPCTESESYCQCAHTLRLLLGSVVDIILINLGYWMLEAPTVDPVAGYAMAVVIRVGKVSDMPPLPKEFPRCASFKRPEFLV